MGCGELSAAYFRGKDLREVLDNDRILVQHPSNAPLSFKTL